MNPTDSIAPLEEFRQLQKSPKSTLPTVQQSLSGGNGCVRGSKNPGQGLLNPPIPQDYIYRWEGNMFTVRDNVTRFSLPLAKEFFIFLFYNYFWGVFPF